MTSFEEETSCTLCLKNITDRNIEAINDVTRDILDVLMLKLKFDGRRKDVICEACRKKLNAAFEFKSTCLNTDNRIIPYVDCEKTLQLDLREIYIKETTNEEVKDILYHRICRLCMQLLNGEFRYILEGELDAIEKFVPEININIVKDPVICKPCFDSLCTHNNFLKDCLEVEEKSGNICGNSATESQIDISPFEVFIKSENFNKQFIKTECEDVKLEEEEEGSVTLPQCSYNEASENTDRKDVEEIESKKHLLMHEEPSEVRRYQCDACFFTSKHKACFVQHQRSHESSSKARLYKCNICDFQTKWRSSFKYHRIKHNDSSEVTTYKCSDCDYETRNKHHFATHLLIHESPCQTSKYRCNFCNHETIYKSVFKFHQLTHKLPSEVQMYSCNDCGYKSKHKPYLVRHMLTHKDSSQVQIFKCELCDYESKYKSSLSYHRLRHKGAPQAQTYRCNDCDYEAKHKNNIRYHVLKHKDQSQMPTYKCDACDYESKYKTNLTRHQLKHRPVKKVHYSKGTSETQEHDSQKASSISRFMKQKIRAILNV
ncbi:zinc finger protein 578-like [Anoplophora glabripennis]|uniref:zinc finger protein 578-like n=1 Tax=Anoplophora glabripennis TaxID=217634 RepID=UPI0008739D45|nr:zinc finger protein 578-like [Anoplophora glabripennis]